VPIWKAWTLSPAGSAAGVASGAATGVVAASAACSLRLQAASAAPSATTSSGSAALRTCDMADSLGGPPDSGGGAGVRQAMAACAGGTLECGAGLNPQVPATTPVRGRPWRQAMQWKAGALLLLAALAPAPALAAREAAGDSDLQHVVEHVAACMGDRRMVLLGEAQGTREVPLLVAGLAERGSRKGPLLLALEIHGSEHRPLADYLDGDGSEAARERLRKRPYWARPRERNDGRRSEDMLDLVERMRQLRAQGRDVAILPFDVGDGDGRDKAMADHVRKAWEA